MTAAYFHLAACLFILVVLRSELRLMDVLASWGFCIGFRERAVTWRMEKCVSWRLSSATINTLTRETFQMNIVNIIKLHFVQINIKSCNQHDICNVTLIIKQCVKYIQK